MLPYGIPAYTEAGQLLRLPFNIIGWVVTSYSDSTCTVMTPFGFYHVRVQDMLAPEPVDFDDDNNNEGSTSCSHS